MASECLATMLECVETIEDDGNATQVAYWLEGNATCFVATREFSAAVTASSLSDLCDQATKAGLACEFEPRP